MIHGRKIKTTAMAAAFLVVFAAICMAAMPHTPFYTARPIWLTHALFSSGEWFGAAVEDRASTFGDAFDQTAIGLEEVAPIDGRITKIRIYTPDTVTGAKFGCFKDEGGSVYATDGAGKNTQHSGEINLASGYNELTAGVDFEEFDCLKNEYPGVFLPDTGGIDASTTGGAGIAYVSQDEVPSEGETFGVFGSNTHVMSLQFYVESGSTGAGLDALLLENGDYLLTEAGDKLLLE